MSMLMETKILFFPKRCRGENFALYLAEKWRGLLLYYLFVSCSKCPVYRNFLKNTLYIFKCLRSVSFHFYRLVIIGISDNLVVPGSDPDL
jgi:hypothetical protein